MKSLSIYVLGWQKKFIWVTEKPKKFFGQTNDYAAWNTLYLSDFKGIKKGSEQTILFGHIIFQSKPRTKL